MMDGVNTPSKQVALYLYYTVPPMEAMERGVIFQHDCGGVGDGQLLLGVDLGVTAPTTDGASQRRGRGRGRG